MSALILTAFFFAFLLDISRAEATRTQLSEHYIDLIPNENDVKFSCVLKEFTTTEFYEMEREFIEIVEL